MFTRNEVLNNIQLASVASGSFFHCPNSFWPWYFIVFRQVWIEYHLLFFKRVLRGYHMWILANNFSVNFSKKGMREIFHIQTEKASPLCLKISSCSLPLNICWVILYEKLLGGFQCSVKCLNFYHSFCRFSVEIPPPLAALRAKGLSVETVNMKQSSLSVCFYFPFLFGASSRLSKGLSALGLVPSILKNWHLGSV